MDAELTELTCSHCGATGGDVLLWWEYAGGGYRWTTRCLDTVACWRRWDEQYLVPVLRRAVAQLNLRRMTA